MQTLPRLSRARQVPSKNIDVDQWLRAFAEEGNPLRPRTRNSIGQRITPRRESPPEPRAPQPSMPSISRGESQHRPTLSNLGQGPSLNDWIKNLEEKYCGGVLSDADRFAIHAGIEARRANPFGRPKFQHRPAPRKRVGAHVAAQKQFEASAPWQYRLETDGRKWFVSCVHRKLLAEFLAGFPVIFPGPVFMASKLGQRAKTFRDSRGRLLKLKWAKRTVQRTLADLRRLGIEQPAGRIGMRGARLRILHPEMLRSEPLELESDPVSAESGTLAHAESGTLSTPKKLHQNLENPINRESDITLSKPESVRASEPSSKAGQIQPPAKPEPPTPQPPVEIEDTRASALRILNALTFRYGPDEAERLMGYVASRVYARENCTTSDGVDPVRTVGYYLKAAEVFLRDASDNDVFRVTTENRYRVNTESLGFDWDGEHWIETKPRDTRPLRLIA